jgi:arylsulfatase A-like enzyme
MATKWLRTQRDPERPFFLYVHMVDPHAPYVPKGRFNEFFVGDDHYDPTIKVEVRGKEQMWDAVGGFPGFSSLEGRDELAFYLAQYDGEILAADEKVSRLLDALDDSGVADSTLVILASDHGEGFGEHNYYWHGAFPYDETSRVPLIVVHDAFEPAVRDEVVSLVDLTPTILDLLGLEAGDSFDGLSLEPLLRDAGARFDRQWVYTESGKVERYQRSIRDREYKLVLVPDPLDQQRFAGAELELYHIAVDPGETANIAQSRPEIRDRLLRELRAWIRQPPPPEAPSADGVSEETAERIRSLGYVQ